MGMMIGNKDKLAIDIGEYWKNSLQNQFIKIWLGGRNITSVDCLAYLPSFHSNLKKNIALLKRLTPTEPPLGLTDEEYFNELENMDTDDRRVLLLDITIMSARCHYIYTKTESYILFSYTDARHEPSDELDLVFKVHIDKDEFIAILEQALNSLSEKWF